MERRWRRPIRRHRRRPPAGKNLAGGGAAAPPPAAGYGPNIGSVTAGRDVHYTVIVAQPAEAKPRPFRTTIPALRDLKYVGREEKFGEIAAALGDPAKDRVVVLHGPAGVGKTELALEFARRSADAQARPYPGGTFFLDGSQGADGSLQGLINGFALLGQTVLGLEVPAGVSIEDQAVGAFRALWDAPTLLVYDNVGEVGPLKPWLPPHGVPCHVIATSVRDGWSPLCRPIAIDPLSEDEALRIVAAAVGADLARRYGEALFRAAGGLAVQLVPSALALHKQARSDRIRPAVLTRLAEKTNGSFAMVYGVLGDDARLLLHAAAWLDPQRIPEAELRLVMERGAGWSADTVADALDECQDLHVLQGAAELRLHQLFARFVAERAPTDAVSAALPGIAAAQAGRLVEIARHLNENPNQPDLAGLLAVYEWTPGSWGMRGTEIPIDAGEAVGLALYETGRFSEAQPWFERAVAAKKKRSCTDGRLDYQNLGVSLHDVGHCLWRLKKFSEARRCYMRAAAAKRQGDRNSCVDYRSFGASLHQIGRCLLDAGQPEIAISWFKRAVEATERPDAHGLIDHDVLGASLHGIGNCFLLQRDSDAALRWFKLAVDAKKLGDKKGRINQDDLGMSLFGAGYCLLLRGDFVDSESWLRQAVVARGHGDLYGRVDKENLARSRNALAWCLRVLRRQRRTRRSGGRTGSIRSDASCRRPLPPLSPLDGLGRPGG